MKKYFLVGVCALLLFVVTGCGNKNQVVCSGTMQDGGVEVKAEIVADFDDSDKLTNVTMTEDMGSKEAADKVCAVFNAFMGSEEGFEVTCSGSKVIIKGYEKLAENEEEEKMIGLTKDEFKKAIEKEAEGKVTCK